MKGYVDRVVIIGGSEVIASHPRSYDRESAIYDPVHHPLSIDDQVRVRRQFGLSQKWVEVAVYSDAAVSGAGADRKGYQHLVKAVLIPNCPFTVVLVDDTSRTARDLEEILHLYKLLRFHNIRLIAISQGIDSTSKQGKVLLTVHGLVDEMYWEEIGLKTHRGLSGCFYRGTSTGGRCYGYNAGKTGRSTRKSRQSL